MIVTGVPAGSVVFIDGVQTSKAMEGKSRPRVLEVTPGAHTIEVRTGDSTAYRENAYVEKGEKRVVIVLSGGNRN